MKVTPKHNKTTFLPLLELPDNLNEFLNFKRLKESIQVIKKMLHILHKVDERIFSTNHVRYYIHSQNVVLCVLQNVLVACRGFKLEIC